MVFPDKEMLCHLATKDLLEELFKRNIGSSIKINKGEKYSVIVEYAEECGTIIRGDSPCILIELPIIN